MVLLFVVDDLFINFDDVCVKVGFDVLCDLLMCI